MWRRRDSGPKKTWRKLTPLSTRFLLRQDWDRPGTCAARTPSAHFNAATKHRTQFPQSQGENVFCHDNAEAEPTAIRTTHSCWILVALWKRRFSFHLYKFSHLDRIHSVAPELYNKSIVDYRKTRLWYILCVFCFLFSFFSFSSSFQPLKEKRKEEKKIERFSFSVEYVNACGQVDDLQKEEKRRKMLRKTRSSVLVVWIRDFDTSNREKAQKNKSETNALE